MWGVQQVRAPQDMQTVQVTMFSSVSLYVLPDPQTTHAGPFVGVRSGFVSSVAISV